MIASPIWNVKYRSIKKNSFQNDKLILMPKQAELWAVPVHYEDLWKIRAPVENVEGFRMDHFDNIIMVCVNKKIFSSKL